VNIAKTISTLNQMHEDGVIGKYAIGGAVAAAFYVEPAETDDLDVFVALKSSPEQSIITLAPIYEYLKRHGCEIEGQYIIIGDWPVQFLPPDSPLVEEALGAAVWKEYGEFRVPVFTAEHLMAIALKLGRPKDKTRLAHFLESSTLGLPKFSEATLNRILEKHDLLDRWHEFMRRFGPSS
jgi:hypothetical protein